MSKEQHSRKGRGIRKAKRRKEEKFIKTRKEEAIKAEGDKR